jgi:hypothetical protein
MEYDEILELLNMKMRNNAKFHWSRYHVDLLNLGVVLPFLLSLGHVLETTDTNSPGYAKEMVERLQWCRKRYCKV